MTINTKLLKAFIAASLLAGLFACKKAQVSAVSPSNDAAVLLAGSLATNNYGMSYLSNDISYTALVNDLKCGGEKIDSATRKSTPGTVAYYNYKIKYTNKVTCNTSNLPDYITNTLTYNGSFEGPKLKVSSLGSTSYRIGGLTPTATSHVLNGEYKNTTQFKTDTTNHGTVNIYLGVKNLLISKTNNTIISGTATVIITGSSSKKTSFSYNGALTFNNASSALLSLNGAEYYIDLITGEAVKK
jgi:hypothetical protein